MLLIKFLNDLFKTGGFILEDAYGKDHVIGKKDVKESLKMKIHDKKLHQKLLLYPDLYFGKSSTNLFVTSDVNVYPLSLEKL